MRRKDVVQTELVIDEAQHLLEELNRVVFELTNLLKVTVEDDDAGQYGS